VKSKIRSLLGIEMSLYGWEFKPFILLLGVLIFTSLCVPLLLLYSYLYIKNTLLNSIKTIKKSNNINKYKGVKWV